MKYKIIIVGYGIVGQHEYNILKDNKNIQCDIYDKFQPKYQMHSNKIYDIAIICVPTDTIDNQCDISQVEDAIQTINSNYYLIKSTIIPTTCETLTNKYNKKIIFSPEYTGATQHSIDINKNFTILGGKKENCLYIQQFLQQIYDANHTFKIVDFKTAELAKYMENCFLGMKVNFCNAFWEICKIYNIDYETLRECFILDPRVNNSHTYVYNDKPYWDSKCLNKDIPALAYATNNHLLLNLLDYNKELQNKYANN